MGNCIVIVDWAKNYENNRTRELKTLQWVPMPNRQDGDGYTALLNHPRGAAHFGAWCALVEVASRCDPRGSLVRRGEKPHNPTSLERMTRIPRAVWVEALPRLVNIGWIKAYEIPQDDAETPQAGAGFPQAGAALEKERKKRKKERKDIGDVASKCDIVAGGCDIEDAIAPADAGTDDDIFPDSPEDKDKAFYHAVESAFLSKNGVFTDYGKEGSAIKGLMKKARARIPDQAEAFAGQMIAEFWKLKETGNEYWRDQPFLPSTLNSAAIWDRVLEKMRVEEVDPVALKLAQGDYS